MADAVVANWDGHDYQARFFWIHASGLLNPEQTHVVEVSYEADGPKGFDDVVVRYNPGQASRRPFRISTAHHQVKFHVSQAGRFGYENLITPEFIGAKKVSILERLRDAVAKAPPKSTFRLVTTDRIADGDTLDKLVSKRDKSLNVDKLFDGTGDRSEMGRVRKLWRDHLAISDDELRAVLETFHIDDGHMSLEAMRGAVDQNFQLVGLVTGGNTLEYKYDAAARALKAAQRNVFTRETFEELCREEGWIRVQPPQDRKNISVRSFSDGPNDYLDAAPENTLSLVEMFDGRHLLSGLDWTADVQPAVEEFLNRVRQTEKSIRLFADAHVSVTFLAGAIFGFKTTTDVELMQKGGRFPPSVWRADDGKTGSAAVEAVVDRDEGDDVAVVVSFSRDALADVEDYIADGGLKIARILHVSAAGGPGPKAIAGGEHAADLADQIAARVKAMRVARGARVHIFIAAPNALTFFLGQNRQSMGPVTLYEFDFGGAANGSYHPSFRIG